MVYCQWIDLNSLLTKYEEEKNYMIANKCIGRFHKGDTSVFLFFLFLNMLFIKSWNENICQITHILSLKQDTCKCLPTYDFWILNLYLGDNLKVVHNDIDKY